MSAFVLDVSVAAAWLLRGQADSYADRVLELLARGRAIVPPLFVWEMVNVMVVAERRKQVDAERVDTALDFVFALPIEVVPDDPVPTAVSLLLLARRHGLSAYDAAYLELAMRRGLPLATRDAALRRAARVIGIGDVRA